MYSKIRNIRRVCSNALRHGTEVLNEEWVYSGIPRDKCSQSMYSKTSNEIVNTNHATQRSSTEQNSSTMNSIDRGRSYTCINIS